MCQAYEAEHNYIVQGEHRATTEGFRAAFHGELQTTNPYGGFETYNRNAWDHGYRCYAEKILPWPIAKRFDYDTRKYIEQTFEASGKLPFMLSI